MINCKKCEHFPVCMWNGQKQDNCGFYEEARPQGEFTIDELKKWLYEIAYNNTNNDFGKYCVEIVDRLDGFKRFVADTIKEKEE